MMADCPKCDPLSPELDEDGRPYACYFCGDTGRVPKALADAYWQERHDQVEYVRLLPVVDGKHLVLVRARCADECWGWHEERPLLPAAILPKPVRVPFDPLTDDDLPF